MGQLGIGNITTIPNSSPVSSSITAGASSVTSGSYHSCAILNTNSPIVCWGSNTNGELGSPVGPSGTPNPNPMPVFGFQ